MLAGWLTTLLGWRSPQVGYLLTGAGGALLSGVLWRIGRRDRRTRYRPLQWTLADVLMASASAATLLMVLTLSLARPGLLLYTPYPRLTLPGVEPLVGGGLALLSAPAWIPSSAFRPLLRRQPRRRAGRPPRPRRGGAAISFEHVTFTYPDRPAPVLRDISLEVPPGRFALVTGPSGVGKSTLLRCINGLVPHASGGRFSGRVRVGGVDTRAARPGVLARWVGFVFQDPEAQFVTDRVEEEVAFALENAGVEPRRMRARVEEVLDRLDLAHLRHRPLHTLSGGEMQRVAIASALALEPAVLVLDEPTSQLDPEAAQEVLDRVDRLRRDLGITVVLAEHRLERVLGYADLLIYLPDLGASPRVGPVREVLRETGARPTHEGAETLVEDYAEALDAYAEAFAQVLAERGPVTKLKVTV